MIDRIMKDKLPSDISDVYPNDFQRYRQNEKRKRKDYFQEYNDEVLDATYESWKEGVKTSIGFWIICWTVIIITVLSILQSCSHLAGMGS